jgi:hypothetical protein
VTTQTAADLPGLIRELNKGATCSFWEDTINFHADNKNTVKEIKKAQNAMLYANEILLPVFEALVAYNTILISKLNNGLELTVEENNALQLGVKSVSLLKQSR